MPHLSRRTAASLVAAAALTGLLAGCPAKDPAPSGSAAPSAVTELSPSAAAPVAAAPTCAEVKGAMVRGVLDPYHAFGDDGAPLAEGMFSGEDGLVLAVQQPCVTGVLGGEIGNVTVGTIMSSVVNTTGRYWAVALCGKPAERAQCVVQFVLDDRDPIESVAIQDQKLILVYLTRPTDAAAATVAVRRTTIYVAAGKALKEESRADAPYTP